MKVNVLIVEDELVLQRSIREVLEKEGLSVRGAGNAEDALVEVGRAVPDLVVLDVRLPGMNGFDFCRKLRETPAWKAVPVIYLTSKEDEASIVLGLESGGDDYVTKPFRAGELVARIRAVLRRVGKAESPGEVLRGGAVNLDLARRELRVGKVKVEVPRKEFDLLFLLLAKKGRVLSRSYLLQKAWENAQDATEGSLNTHIYSLRKRLGRHGECIQSVEGMGYKWEDL